MTTDAEILEKFTNYALLTISEIRENPITKVAEFELSCAENILKPIKECNDYDYHCKNRNVYANVIPHLEAAYYFLVWQKREPQGCGCLMSFIVCMIESLIHREFGNEDELALEISRIAALVGEAHILLGDSNETAYRWIVENAISGNPHKWNMLNRLEESDSDYSSKCDCLFESFCEKKNIDGYTQYIKKYNLYIDDGLEDDENLGHGTDIFGYMFKDGELVFDVMQYAVVEGKSEITYYLSEITASDINRGRWTVEKNQSFADE
ncbi:hypothetical protein AGMMS49975_12640 [Clostridia bacterium]|nr:hypothetical protein AGMMS49975_12640 [Clostridia bacterium]